MDEQRDVINDEKDKRRARIEKAVWDEARKKEADVKEENNARRATTHLEALRQDKVDAMHRATAKREQVRREQLRDKKINEITELRMRKFREKQYLDQARASLEPTFDAGDKEEGEGEESKMEETLTRAERKEQEEFQRTFEFQQRAERRSQRAEAIKKEEAKKEKLDQLGAKDPMAREIVRIRQWFKEDEEKKEMLEEAKLSKELAVEQAQRKKLHEDNQRVVTFERLEKVRRARSREREDRRNEGARARIRDAAIGSALPACLSY